ncbi:MULTISPECIES: SRPBCC family protein [unclassified Isoptericola]|uniref:SRPBCC family protein n=1 Tax=Isoptericola sp. NPDC057191 TaxID=3346041 RepID=UPI00363B886A
MTTESIRIDRLLPHPPARVWRLLVEPDLHARWWVAGDVQPVVGHRFTLDMGGFGPQTCEVLRVEHERLFAYTFAEGVLDSVLTWRLEPHEDGTLLRFEHSGLDLATPAGRQAFEGMGRGWPAVIGRLETVAAP